MLWEYPLCCREKAWAAIVGTDATGKEQWQLSDDEIAKGMKRAEATSQPRLDDCAPVAQDWMFTAKAQRPAKDAVSLSWPSGH